MVLLETRDVIKEYNNGNITNTTRVLNQINLCINTNDFVVITGPSGSGKTTLINILSGLEKATSGQVLFMNNDFSTINEKQMALIRQKQIGFVFQTYNLLPNLTVYENIAITSIIAGNENKERILTLLQQFNLLTYKDYFPNQLSGGMQQRTAIIRALINDPMIIFADEPTGNLDSHASSEVMENFKLLHDKFNKTVVLVTHSLDQVKYGTRHIQIVDGQIISDESWQK